MDFLTLVNELKRRKTIPVLSIQQPWAWLIVNKYKDVENRTWATKFRGPVLIHAGKKMDRAYDPKGPLGYIPLIDLFASAANIMPPREFQLGGIVGLAVFTDCVTESDSRWFNGPYAFVVGNAWPLPFTSLRGQLGFFEVDTSLVNFGIGPVDHEPRTFV